MKNTGKQQAHCDATVGIIGFGHLGASLAMPLAGGGIPRERLLISCRGSERTLAKARALGVEDCLTDTETLMSCSDTIFAACRPQDLLSLPAGVVRQGALIVSCMAGLPLSMLSRYFGRSVVRMMCSGPESIADGLGIAVTTPRDRRVREIIGLMGMEVYDVGFEEELDSFTVGICIPPILLNVPRSAAEVEAALDVMKERYPVYGRLMSWIDRVMASHDKPERGKCLENVMTKGGISESMVDCLNKGGSFLEALERGLERGREITAEIRQCVAIRAADSETEIIAEKAG